MVAYNIKDVPVIAAFNLISKGCQRTYGLARGKLGNKPLPTLKTLYWMREFASLFELSCSASYFSKWQHSR